MIEKKKKVHIEQTKSTLTFTHSPNNYHNISQNIYFSLWLVTVSYFIILFWLIRYWHFNNCENIVKFVVLVEKYI